MELQEFFGCPYRINLLPYFLYAYRKNDIDSLGNKVTYLAGHILFKLLRKSIWYYLKHDEFAKLKKTAVKLEKYISNGDFLQVLSKKTSFNNNISEQMRELGQNNEVFLEKRSTCYRDVHLQVYPLIPYLSQMVHIKTSTKVKCNLGYHSSYVGFLCIFGTSETKHVGKQMIFARDVFASIPPNMQELYTYLQIEQPNSYSQYYVVINNACLPVTKECWLQLNLQDLKQHFQWIEAYQDECFKIIRYKDGILYRQIADRFWISPTDKSYWPHTITYPFLTSYFIDIVKYFKHNAFPKNILALNNLKHSIISCDPQYSYYFKETLSAYTFKTDKHRQVLPCANPESKKWILYLPKVKIMFTSFRGLTQEDCIVCCDKLKCFDCNKIYTLRLKLENKGPKYFFPTTGISQELGTVTCFQSPLKIVLQTMHIYLETVTPHASKVFTTKENYRVVNYTLTTQYLFITIEMEHALANADKLCSINGQKGVSFLIPKEEFPSLSNSPNDKNVIVPDLLINPNSLISRQTMGQILEMLEDGKDYTYIRNSVGQRKVGRALVGSVFYFLINYLSVEHMYVSINCIKDRITNQPIRGKNRGGALRIGHMETQNCLRGQGLSRCFDEKMTADVIVHNGMIIPKSVLLCMEDAKFFKVLLTLETCEFIEEDDGVQQAS